MLSLVDYDDSGRQHLVVSDKVLSELADDKCSRGLQLLKYIKEQY